MLYLDMCSNLALVRADISRLPFSSGTVDVVHAGAALHCWPSPSNAVSLLLPNVLLQYLHQWVHPQWCSIVG